ncbi:MAG: CHASE2 domain-containing protein [Rubrivivax sp.]
MTTAPAAARSWWIWCSAAVVGLLVLLSPLNGWLSRAGVDWQLRRVAPPRSDAGVLVLDIDDASLAALKDAFGPWPFKRDVYALAIEQLREWGARGVAIDLLLADAQPGDAALARALARPGAPVVLAAAGLRHASDKPTPAAALASAAPAPLPAQGWPTLALPTSTVWPAEDRPPPLGVITTPLDDDGVLRRLPLWHGAGALQLPLMSLAVQQAVDGAAPLPRAEGASALPRADSAAALPPVDAAGAVHLAFPARSAWPAVRPFAELAEAALGRRDAAALRRQVQGRVVFIGSSALLADAVMTVQGQMSGTVALAQAYAALGQAGWVRPPSSALNAALLLVALLPAAWTVRRGRPSPGRDAAAAGLALLLGGALALAALLIARQPSLWAAPLLALLLGLALSLLAYQRQQAAHQRQLAQQAAVAADAARAKSAFLANISHEMRTPLNALLGVADLLADSPLTAEQRQHVQVFRESGRALHELINDLLDLSKIEADRLQLDLQPFSLQRSLSHLGALMRPRAEGKGLRLRLDLAGDLPDGVLGDRQRLEQGLMNLVGNAVKFTHQGEVRLSARRDPAHAGQILFEVADTGIGIAPSKLETIFEPFAQADGSITRLYGGTGLGLALTRSVVQRMGGSVQVSSTPGVGSVFALRLPLPPAAAPAVPAAAPAPDAAAAPAVPLRVLLAEDNEVNVYIFRAMLADQPLALEVASNGPTALDLLQRQAFDIAFLDVQMPDLDGLSVTRELRRWEAGDAPAGRRRTPVVALTANAFASDVQASLDAGCDRHLSKPFFKAQLLDALQQLALPAVPQPPAAPAPPVLDEAAGLRRVGGDAALFERLIEHATVFMEAWPQSFDEALAAGKAERAQRLLQDLGSIAGSLGADALVRAAAALQQAPAAAEARARLQEAIAPVIVALTRRLGGRR